MSEAVRGKFCMNDLGARQHDGPAADRAGGAGPDFSGSITPSYVRTVFLGPDGLRPGWGFAFYVVSFLFLQRIASELAWSHNLGASGLWPMLLEELLNFLAALVPAVALSFMEHRSWGAYGLPLDRAFGKRFWVGLVWGFAAVTLLITALYGVRAFSFGHVVLHGVRIWKFAGFWAVMFVFVGLFEEFLLRGYSQFTLARGLGFWPAAILLSGMFGLIHLRNAGEQWIGLLAAACIGLFFCLTLKRTGNLWFAIGFHAAWDWGETFFYSVPDSGVVSPGHLLSSSLQGPRWLSGGSAGPEGSTICLLVIVIVWVLFDKTHPATEGRN